MIRLVSRSPGDFSTGVSERSEFCFNTDILAGVLSYLSTFLDGGRVAVYPRKQSFLSYILVKPLSWQNAKIEGQLSKLCCSVSFSALASENQVVTVHP